MEMMMLNYLEDQHVVLQMIQSSVSSSPDDNNNNNNNKSQQGHHSYRSAKEKRGQQRRQPRLVYFLLLIIISLAFLPSSTSSSEAEEECFVTNKDGDYECTIIPTDNDDEQDRRQLLEMELEEIMITQNDDHCKDKHEECNDWAARGECDRNPDYMLVDCRKSCNKCQQQQQTFLHKNTWGEPQEVVKGGNRYDKVMDLLVTTQQYMTQKVFVDPMYSSIKDTCHNEHTKCTLWASRGECDHNAKYMKKSCAPSCQTCELLDFKFRCPMDDPETLRAKSIWNQPGDLDQMFLRFINDPFVQDTYQPIIHSKPKYIGLEPRDDGSTITAVVLEEEEEKETKGENITKNQLGIPIMDDGPWIVTLESFLTEQECDTLVELGYVEGYKRGGVLGVENKDGSYESLHQVASRTSSVAWCEHADKCYNNQTTQRIIEKMSNITGIPDTNAEYIQILNYKETQFYRRHHDYIPHHITRSYGVRLMTLFMYLNSVEAGGGTKFSDLGLTIMPKKGKALLWPSVLNDSPDQRDDRMWHEALPVDKGTKFAANAWFHSRDFKDAYARDCI